MTTWMDPGHGEFVSLAVSLCAAVFLVALVWSLGSDRRSTPPW